jgi:hypothetical protein
MTNQLTLDQIGAEAIRLMTGADRDVAKAQAHIKQVWDAFTAAEDAGTTITINGVSLKKDWAKLINRTTRYCQMIAKDGDRKNQKKSDANSVRPLALLKQLITVISETHDPAVMRGEAAEICDTIKWHPPAFKKDNEELRRYNRTGSRVKKSEEKKPVKHTTPPRDRHSTWSGMDAYHAKVVAKNRVTCPFCIAAMAAGVSLRKNPVSQRRRLSADLKSKREYQVRLEKWIAEAKDGDELKRYTERLSECRESIPYLEKELAKLADVKTPEQAVEYEKQRQAAHAAAMADIITIKLTEAQARECERDERKIMFVAKDYQEEAKWHIHDLERRIKRTEEKHAEFMKTRGVRDLLDFTNDSKGAKEAKATVAQFRGTIKACEGAIRAIIFGDLNSDDPKRNLHEWYKRHQAELEAEREKRYQQTIKTLDQSYVHGVACGVHPPGSKSLCGLELNGDYEATSEHDKVTCPRCYFKDKDEEALRA